MDIGKDYWFIAFAVVTFIGINIGAMVLCFRRKKYVCLSSVFELAFLVLFAAQLYFFADPVYHRISKQSESQADYSSMKIHVFACIGLVLGRVCLFIGQILIIFFRLKK